MKILYGVQGTGNGHISRSREMVKALRDLGHDVFVVFSGRQPDAYWDIDMFAPYRIYHGLTFAVKNGRIDYWDSLKQLGIRRMYADVREFSDTADLVISDFEPITSRIASRNKIPSIGIGHQYAFCHHIPKPSGYLLARTVMALFAPVKIPLGLHWHHFHQPILPPIVPDFGDIPERTKETFVLVYLPFDPRDQVLEFLSCFPDTQFRYYTSVEQRSRKDNIRLCPFSRTNFLRDLKSCSGVVTNSGFELVSEAIFLGKKIIVRPLDRQYEQIANAQALKQLDLGDVMNTLDPNALAPWLEKPIPKPTRYPRVAQRIAQWIDTGDWQVTQELAEQLWHETSPGIVDQ